MRACYRLMLPIVLLLWAGCAALPSGQAAEPRLQRIDDFIVIQTVAGDTLSNLAEKFLKDPSQAWVIAEFNDISEVVPGTQLIIPLWTYSRGGLKSNGYQTVPVLTYHSFSLDKPGKMTVTAAAFEAQMKFLKENGYRFISLSQLIEFMDYKAPLPSRAVAITIDDGWRSFYEIGLPILKKYGIPATLFVYTDFIGGSKAMTWSQVKDVAESGIDIQCHTRTHRNLTVLREKESLKEYLSAVEAEIVTSQKEIKSRLNRECRYLAYPYGKTNSLVISMLQKHGYRAGFTVSREANAFFNDQYRIGRAVIYGTYDMDRFKRNLSVFHPMVLK
jgi:peptidoglycan/xylan/chitin deacetylase (PgdA/CDA1 family)